MSLVVNLWGGPGSTKSTNAFGITYFLKLQQIEADIANEYAKEKVWDESFKILEDQNYIFAKQLKKVRRLDNKVDVIVSDSPLLLSILYNKTEGEHFVKNVLHAFNSYHNLNYFIGRPNYYTETGRMQDKETAMQLDQSLIDLMNTYQIPYKYIAVDDNDREYVARTIVADILKELGR